MQIIKPLQEKLVSCRGSGRWRAIADKAGCSYFTVARIARGELTNPSSELAERLFAAIQATRGRKWVVRA